MILLLSLLLLTSTFGTLAWLPPLRAFLLLAGCIATHLANLDATDISRRNRLIATGYPSGVRAAVKRAGGVVVPAQGPLGIVTLDDGRGLRGRPICLWIGLHVHYPFIG